MKFLLQLTFLLFLAHFAAAQNGVYFIPTEKETDKARTLLKHTDNDSLKMRAYYHLSSYYLLPFEFGEVLASLVDNACYILTEKSRRLKGFEPRLDVSTQVVDDNVQLQVRDNGRGIFPKEASQLFNPFFTTKPTAKGTGLGLYMSKEVVEYLHGQMHIDSVEEEYTQVTILLPLKMELVTS